MELRLHIELGTTMEADSFVITLRRMIARRGNIRNATSDNLLIQLVADNGFPWLTQRKNFYSKIFLYYNKKTIFQIKKISYPSERIDFLTKEKSCYTYMKNYQFSKQNVSYTCSKKVNFPNLKGFL